MNLRRAASCYISALRIRSHQILDKCVAVLLMTEHPKCRSLSFSMSKLSFSVMCTNVVFVLTQLVDFNLWARWSALLERPTETLVYFIKTDVCNLVLAWRGVRRSQEVPRGRRLELPMWLHDRLCLYFANISLCPNKSLCWTFIWLFGTFICWFIFIPSYIALWVNISYWQFTSILLNI